MAEILWRYKELKDKYKELYRYKDTRHNLNKKFVNRFIWDGVDDLTPPISKSAWIEKILLKNGTIGLGEVEGEPTLVRGQLGGDLLPRFGVPSKFIWYTDGGLSGEWEIGKDCTVCFNDFNGYPAQMTIDRYSQMLADTDLSIESLIRYARLLPIPVAKSDTELNELKEALKDIENGKTKVIKTLIRESGDMLELTDPEQIKNMECLSRLHDELTKRVCSEFGISIDTKDKKAQIQTAELDAFKQYDLFSVIPDFIERKTFCEWSNEMFGLNMDVKVSECFDDLSNGKNKEADSSEDGVIGEEDQENEIKDNSGEETTDSDE